MVIAFKMGITGNFAENPYAAAQRFIYRYELPQYHLDEIANFITKNVNPAQIGFQKDEFVDPFTGSNRYTPASAPVVPAPAPAPVPAPANNAAAQTYAKPTSTTEMNILPVVGANFGITC